MLLATLALAAVSLVSPTPAHAASVVATFDSVTLVANPNGYTVNNLQNTIDGSNAGPVYGGIFNGQADATGVIIDYGYAVPKLEVTALELHNNGGGILTDRDGIGGATVEVFDSADNLLFSGPLTADNGGGAFVTTFPSPLDDVSRVRLSSITNLLGHAAPDIIWRELRMLQNVSTPSLATQINADGYSDDVTVSGTEGLAGTLDWTLFGPVPAGPGDSCAAVDWVGAPTFASGTVPITGDGLVVTTPPVEPTAVGCYSYADVLSGPSYTADAVSVVGQPSETFVIPVNPEISLVKSAAPNDAGSFVLGQEITFSFVARNTGNVPLTDVTVSETVFTGSGTMSAITCPGGNGSVSLPVGDFVTCTATYTVTQDDIDAGSLDNTAIAEGTPPTGPAVSSDPSSTEVPGVQAPAVTLLKSATPEVGTAAGDVISYSFLITNTGNLTLTNVTAVETNFTGAGTLPAPTCPAEAAALLPGEDVTCTAEYALTQADVDAGESISNTAIATGAPPIGDSVSSDPSSAVVTMNAESELGLTKAAELVDTNGDGQLTPGDQIDWIITVSNLGATTISQIGVADPTAGTVTCPETVLAPGASMICTVPAHAVTPDDAIAGVVTNVAVASGLGPNEELLSVTAQASAEVSTASLPVTGAANVLAGGATAMLLLVGGAVLAIRRTRTS